MIIEFSNRDAARAWYESPAYQAIHPLRTMHIGGDVILVDGVAPGNDAARTATVLQSPR